MEPICAPALSSEASPTASAGVRFRPDIQGLRAIAVVLVVAYHAGLPIPGGYVGVDVFFVVSGFVIAGSLRAAVASPTQFQLRTFYLRRIRRLLPALATMVCICLLLSIALVPLTAQDMTARTGGASAVFSANLWLIRASDTGYFDPNAQANAMLHTWSLSVEEQFYFVFPAVLLATGWVGRRRRSADGRWTWWAIVLGTLVSAAASLLLSFGLWDPHGLGRRIAFFSAPTRAWEFAVGALLALGARGAVPRSRRGSCLAGAAGVLLLVLATLLFDGSTPFPGVAALVPVLGAALIIAAGSSVPQTWITKTLSRRPLMRTGDLSYSWYLWHWPLIVFATAVWPAETIAPVIAAAASLIPASISLRYIEQPIRRSRSPRTSRTLLLAVACIVAPLLAAAALLGAHRELMSKPRAEAVALHADVARGCTRSDLLEARDACTVDRWATDRRAVLLGDSNAGQLSEAFLEATERTGYDATLGTRSLCPFIDLRLTVSGAEQDGCETFNSDVLTALTNDPPDLVVLSAASDDYIESDRFGLIDADQAAPITTPDRKAAAWAEGLERTVIRLEAAGIDVVLVHPVPRPSRAGSATDLAAAHVLGASPTRSPTFDRHKALDVRHRSLTAEQSGAGGAPEFDPFAVLCPTSPCPTFSDGAWLYRDPMHISVPGSRHLATGLTAAIRRVEES